MSREDWYRNADWNSEIEDAFFAKLARARSQRDQYLVIQALSLTDRYPEVALRLVDTYFETRNDDFDDVRALMARARAYMTLGQLSKAVEAYKAVLDREAEFPRHKTHTYLDLPYLVACEELTDEYDFALSLLAEGLGDVVFPVDRFIRHASKALIASARGENIVARAEAVDALKVAQVKTSGFRYHKDVGLVGSDHAAVLAKLRKLAD
jgi:tetratricopeptide (TPR) repeat protein